MKKVFNKLCSTFHNKSKIILWTSVITDKRVEQFIDPVS